MDPDKRRKVEAFVKSSNGLKQQNDALCDQELQASGLTWADLNELSRSQTAEVLEAYASSSLGSGPDD